MPPKPFITEKNEGNSPGSENRIAEIFSVAGRKREKVLITFITAGDPDIATTGELVLAMEKAGADIVELGVPYSDPLADGPVIQEASRRAIKSGTNLRKIFQLVKSLRQKTGIPIILMTYYNPLLRYGLAEVAAEAEKAGVDGFIVPDLPMEEADEFDNLLQEKGICLIPLVAPTSGEQRIRAICAKARGFVYCVSLTGVTGVRAGIPDNLKEFMDTVRKSTDKPLAVGFGISTPAQAAAVAEYCDGVIVGSALVKTISEYSGKTGLLAAVSEKVRALKEPLRKADPGQIVSASGR